MKNLGRIILAAHDARFSLEGIEQASCPAAADIAAGHLLVSTSTLRALGDVETAERFERAGGDALMAKFVSQAITDRGRQ